MDTALNTTATDRPSMVETVELLLRDRDGANARCAESEAAMGLMPSMIGVSLLGLGAHALAHGWLLASLERPWVDLTTTEYAGITLLAYAGGMFGAQMASLPSAYFYALLTGVRTHGWRIAVEAMRSQATAAVVLLGLVPVYLAAGAGLSLADQPELAKAFVVLVGFSLPFVAGLAGVGSMFRAFIGLVREARPEGRTPMPVLLVVAWSVLFTALAPLGVWRIFTTLI